MNEDFKYLLELDYNQLVERGMVIENYHLCDDDPSMRDYFLEELRIVDSLIDKKEQESLPAFDENTPEECFEVYFGVSKEDYLSSL